MAAIPQRSLLRPWAAIVIELLTLRAPTPNHVFAITRVFLDDPASAARQGDVHACVKIGTLRYTLASLSAESPYTELLEPFVLDQEFTLYVWGGPRSDELVVHFEGYHECDEDEAGEEAEALSFFRKLEALISGDDDDSSDEEDEEDEDTDESASISEDDDDSRGEEDEDSDESASISEDDDDSSDEEDEDSDQSASISEDDDDSIGDGEDEYSSDDEDNDESASSSDGDDGSDAEDDEYSTEESEEEEEDEESHDEVDGAGDDVMLQRRNFDPNGQFVAVPAQQFASSGSTAGFMRVAALESQEEGDNCNKQISVLYRCTHFSVSGGGMRVRESTPVYQLWFVVPPAATGNTVRTLQVVGASLAPHVYPVRYCQRLQRLWSSLLTEVSVPTWAEHLEVLVDFGILRTVDKTPKRMNQMRAALEGMVTKDFHPELHLEFELPEPAQCGAGEDCAVCFELLEGDDLAAWPGCSKLHVFHGACLDLILERSDKCPLCRLVWSIEPKGPNPLKNRKEKEVDRQAAAVSSAGSNAKNVRQAVAKACSVLFSFVCMISFLRFMMYS